jgi:membrane protein DedA with SNARE-associated domain
MDKGGGFLLSRVSGLVLYAIGLGILIYLAVHDIYFSNDQSSNSAYINISLAVVALFLLASGFWIRRKSKKS